MCDDHNDSCRLDFYKLILLQVDVTKIIVLFFSEATQFFHISNVNCLIGTNQTFFKSVMFIVNLQNRNPYFAATTLHLPVIRQTQIDTAFERLTYKIITHHQTIPDPIAAG